LAFFAIFNFIFNVLVGFVARLNVDLACECHFLFKTVKGKPIISLSRNDRDIYLVESISSVIKGKLFIDPN